MEPQTLHHYDPVHRVLIVRISGDFGLAQVKASARESSGIAHRHLVRGIILDMNDARVTLSEADQEELDAFFPTLYGGETIPVALVSRTAFLDGLKHARRARESGRNAIACLTYCEAYAWIDYCTIGYVPEGRQDLVLRIHNAITRLTDEELLGLLEVIEAHEVPQLHSP